MDEKIFSPLTEFLEKTPAVLPGFAVGCDDAGLWWIKFRIDVDHHLAWNLIQELGCVVNYISIDERLPTAFYPISPAPYMNGGPRDFLSWIIESKSEEFLPGDLREWLAGRLPDPIDDLEQWNIED